MDPRRFDTLARIAAASPHSRRKALLRFSGGLAALLGGGLPARSLAQAGTPAASPAANETPIEFL